MNFSEFEHAGWQRVANRYHDAFARLTTQAIAPLLDAVGLKKGIRLLDIASGPGYVAGAAAERGADVVGIDFAAAMVAEARERYPQVRFQEGDAEALPFPDASFDAVTMAFGLLHLGGPEKALREACRVLRPAGRFAFTVWARPEESRGFGIVVEAIQKHGRTDVGPPPGPPFFRFSDGAETRRCLAQAGFAGGEVRTLPLVWRFAAPEELFEMMLGSSVRTGAILRAQQPAALEAIRAAVTAGAAQYRRDGGVEIPTPAVLASATRRSA